MQSIPVNSAPARRNRVICAAVLALTAISLWTGPATGQLEDLRLPISLDADSTDYDGNSSMLMFQGLRLTQGSIGVAADEGRASNLDFEDSVWHFSGNVVIDTDMGHIECDSADLQFNGHQLQTATITGTPATFELQRAGSDEITYAEAGRLAYDFKSGIVEFSEQAVITEGGNKISSSYLMYNIVERRINAQSAGDGDQKVKIEYTPKAGEVDALGQLPADDAAETTDGGTDDQ